jgi:hypothetical protein
MPKLIVINCNGCTLLTDVHKPITLYCSGCKWISQCEDFESNIRILKHCQTIFKRKLTARKLNHIIPAITEIYYSPGCKGEFIAHRAFLKKL